MAEQKELESRVHDLEKEHTTISVNIAQLTSDMANVKSNLENGISKTLEKIWMKIDETCRTMPLLQGVVNSNTKWINIWQKAVVWIAVVGVLGGVISLAFYLLRSIPSESPVL